mgnify:FL=1
MNLPSIKETISGVAVGAADIGMHYIDKKQGYTKPFQNATDLFRTGITIGGMLWYGYKGDVTGLVLYDNGLPLLTESVIYAVGVYTNNKIPGAPTADPYVATQRLPPAPAVVAAPAAVPKAPTRLNVV